MAASESSSSSCFSGLTASASGAAPGITDVDLEREAEGAVFLAVAFVVLEVDGNEGVAAAVAVSAAAFLPFAVGLARGLGGAVLS